MWSSKVVDQKPPICQCLFVWFTSEEKWLWKVRWPSSLKQLAEILVQPLTWLQLNVVLTNSDCHHVVSHMHLPRIQSLSLTIGLRRKCSFSRIVSVRTLTIWISPSVSSRSPTSGESTSVCFLHLFPYSVVMCWVMHRQFFLCVLLVSYCQGLWGVTVLFRNGWLWSTTQAMTNAIARCPGLVKYDQIYSRFSDKNTICVIGGLMTFWLHNFGLVNFKIICHALPPL
jgi:hypothetical protein